MVVSVTPFCICYPICYPILVFLKNGVTLYVNTYSYSDQSNILLLLLLLLILLPCYLILYIHTYTRTDMRYRGRRETYIYVCFKKSGNGVTLYVNNGEYGGFERKIRRKTTIYGVRKCYPILENQVTNGVTLSKSGNK